MLHCHFIFSTISLFYYRELQQMECCEYYYFLLPLVKNDPKHCQSNQFLITRKESLELLLFFTGMPSFSYLAKWHTKKNRELQMCVYSNMQLIQKRSSFRGGGKNNFGKMWDLSHIFRNSTSLSSSLYKSRVPSMMQMY